MEKKKIICLFLFVVLILVSSSCQTRQITDIKPAMTKEKVISLWGPTNLISHKNSVIFVEDRVARTECRPEERR